MSFISRLCGSTSTREKASLTPTPTQRTSRFFSSAAEPDCQLRYSLVRVTVYMRIGPWTHLWSQRIGSFWRYSSAVYASEKGFTSTHLALVIHRQYCGHPARTTARADLFS